MFKACGGKKVGKSEEVVDCGEAGHSKMHELKVSLLKHREAHKNKKGVIIVARVHPGNYSQ